jgi:transcriptional regulator with XRE-family HTH domain
MTDRTNHWTGQSVEDYVHRITFDFVAQLETKMEELRLSQAELAKSLNVSEGRVSQVLNNPGNMTLKKVVEYSRAVGIKVALVAYFDGDRLHEVGPVNSEIFTKCWEAFGSPRDFFEFQERTTQDKGFSATASGAHFVWGSFVSQETGAAQPPQPKVSTTSTSTFKTAITIGG